MSLKALVQLFAEKFLVSKKGQIASAASPALDKYTEYTTGFNGPNEWSDVITAPFDGWIRVEGESTGPVYLDVSPYSNALRQGVYRPSGFISCVCRISKGGKINYVFSTSGTISLRRVLLIPCNGSST